MNRVPGPLFDPQLWLEQHGDALYRFALLRVHIPALAEDLVQDTLLAAWRAQDSFAGQSTERTWLIAILKNKIVDHYRRHSREVPLPEMDNMDDALQAMFKSNAGDHWLRPPAVWENPQASLEQSEFWDVMQDCLAKLPERQAQVFSLSELEGLTTDELCKVLGVSPSNVWVLLHRARLRLRECLERSWFGHDTEQSG